MSLPRPSRVRLPDGRRPCRDEYENRGRCGRTRRSGGVFGRASSTPTISPGFDLGSKGSEPDRPGLDRVDLEMCLAPGITCERDANGLFRLGLDDEHCTALSEARASHDERAALVVN